MKDRIDSVLQHNSYLLKEIIEYINNKNIYIVGNIEDLSDVIINAPILVRLNKTCSWGKCDIVFSDDEVVGYSNYPQKYIVRFPKDGNRDLLLKNYPPELEHKTLFCSLEEWSAATKEIGTPFPLTETIAAYWFLKHTSSHITLLNYSFSEKQTDYTTGKVSYLDEKHKPLVDKQYLSSQDRVTLQRVSL